MSDKSIKRITKKLKLNSIIYGYHNYYNIATHIVKDFLKINFLVIKTL